MTVSKDGKRTPGITFGLRHESRAAVHGPVRNEFEMASALYTLLRQASENSDLAEGGLVGAEVAMPHLMQQSFFQHENLSVAVGDRLFRIRIMMVPG